MATRIRYNTEGTTLVSRRFFTIGIQPTVDGRLESTIKIVLDTVNMKFSFIDVSTGETVFSGGNTKNLAVLKIQAKDGLRELGFEFDSETRVKRYNMDKGKSKVFVGGPGDEQTPVSENISG